MIARIKDNLKTNIPQFSTRRMVKQYVENLYVKALSSPLPLGEGRRRTEPVEVVREMKS